eukprot:9291228-Pyramimonas_sp.AAC.1
MSTTLECMPSHIPRRKNIKSAYGIWPPQRTYSIIHSLTDADVLGNGGGPRALAKGDCNEASRARHRPPKEE